tara:strand:+ start:34310 stop:34903 length:594 start_codon:yes stop_codon:yes gene_type:complete
MTSIYKISKDDWQYLVPFLACLICFVATDLFRVLEKTRFAYWSGGLLDEPYRIITSHFFHGDPKHFLANTFGIVIARYCLKGLGLKGNTFFLLLVGFLIPLQTFIFWLVDIFVFRNPMSLAIGFSGILYGVDAFILLSSFYGKPNFLKYNIDLKKNQEIHQTMIVITGIGIAWSLIPGISLLGHLAGLAAGAFLFFL